MTFLKETSDRWNGAKSFRIWNCWIARVSASCFSAGSTGTPLNVTFCSDDDAQTPNNTVIGMIDEKNPDNSFSKGNIWKKSNDLIVSIPRASHLQGERN